MGIVFDFHFWTIMCKRKMKFKEELMSIKCLTFPLNPVGIVEFSPIKKTGGKRYE